jgi:hypothetical protein
LGGSVGIVSRFNVGVWSEACENRQPGGWSFLGWQKSHACDFVSTQVPFLAPRRNMWFWCVVLACEKISKGTL